MKFRSFKLKIKKKLIVNLTFDNCKTNVFESTVIICEFILLDNLNYI